ncbi:MAG: hypothetical protein ACJ780_17685 [Solirubrobacteraceae bacterium]
MGEVAIAFRRRTPGGGYGEVPVKLGQGQLELIERLVRRDRTAVSSALLAIAGIGAGEVVRGAVLAQVGAAVLRPQTEGAITAQRGEQITRHLTRALQQTDSASRAER